MTASTVATEPIPALNSVRTEELRETFEDLLEGVVEVTGSGPDDLSLTFKTLGTMEIVDADWANWKVTIRTPRGDITFCGVRMSCPRSGILDPESLDA